MTEFPAIEAAEQQFLETRHPVAGAVARRRRNDDEAADAVARARVVAPGSAGSRAEGRKAAPRRRARHLAVNIDEFRAGIHR